MAQAIEDLMTVGNDGKGSQLPPQVSEAGRLDGLLYAATHDALTGLPNRALFRDTLTEAAAAAGSLATLSILLIDLDRFKAVNDTLGHPIGDELLRKVAERLRSLTRNSGEMLARLGGDEFGMILPGSPEQASSTASRLIDLLNRPFLIEGHQVNVGASVGLAVCPKDGRPFDRLMRRRRPGTLRR